MTNQEFKAYIERLQREQHTKFGEVCDFCGVPPGRWVFLAKKVAARWADDDLPMVFEPEWTACDVCKALIEKRDRAGLLQQAVSTAGKSYIMKDMPREFVMDLEERRRSVAQVHAIFWANWEEHIRPVQNGPENLRPS
jgi:hypothetical protein